MRLTLRTLLAYLDDTLDPAEAKHMGVKLAESPGAQELVERIKKVTRRRGISTPPSSAEIGSPSDPNSVAGYLSDSLPPGQLADFEKTCLESDVHLAEVAACHQILTLLLSEQVRVPPTAYQRMYRIVKGRESVPNRKPSTAIPLGGIIAEPKVDWDEEADGSYTLGMASPSRSYSKGRLLRTLAVSAAFLLAFVALSWWIWPKTSGSNSGNVELAALDVLKKAPSLPVVPTPPPKELTPEVIPPPVEVPMNPGPKEPIEPVVPPVEPKAPDPRLQLTPKLSPVIPGKVTLGRLGKDDALLLAQRPNETEWKRISAKDMPVSAADLLVCLPGFQTEIQLESGIKMNLRGNLPELLPITLLETQLQLHVPYEGYSADFTLIVGRIYLSSNKPTGGKIRFRVRKEIWDISIPDDKTEIVLEVLHNPMPGAPVTTNETAMALHVLRGEVSLLTRPKAIPKVTQGQEVYSISTGIGIDGPRNPDAESGGRGSGYYAATAIYPNAELATAALLTLDAINKRISPTTSITGALAEMFQEEGGGQQLTNARFAVFAAAGISNFNLLADGLSDPNRRWVRDAAIAAARDAIGIDGNQAKLKTLFIDKLKFDETDADFLIHLVRGLSPDEILNPQLQDKVLKQLLAEDIALREAAYAVLYRDIDPECMKNKQLFPLDVGAPLEIRQAYLRNWKAHLDKKNEGK